MLDISKKHFTFFITLIFISATLLGCSSKSYIDARADCDYLVGYNDAGEPALSLKAPEPRVKILLHGDIYVDPWDIYHKLIQGECRSSGNSIVFRGGERGMGTFKVSLSDYFGSIVTFYPTEPLMKKIIDNREEMRGLVETLLKQCDELSNCTAFNAWHDARLQWLIDRNKAVPEFTGYDERHRIVEVNGLICSRVEYNEGKKQFNVDGKVTYPFNRWGWVPRDEYVSDTVCPLVIDGKMTMLRLYVVYARVQYSISKEDNVEDIADFEKAFQSSMDSIHIFGEVSQKLE